MTTSDTAPGRTAGADPPADSAAFRVQRGVTGTTVRRSPRWPPMSDFGHQRALDGLRALAVAAVCVYHARFDWARGGFLGVSAFFTLSGFLITSLLLREWSRAGAVDLRRFLSRRFRRLLPASWLTLALVLAMGAAGVWSTEQLRALRTDVPAALAEVLNWVFVFQGRSYGEQFAAPSPIEHFWSLAVEQQFYLVFPVVVAVLLGLGARRSRRRALRPLFGVLVVGTVLSAAANGLVARRDVFAAYFSTPTRLAELLVGALLAFGFTGGLRLASATARRLVAVAGVVGMVASLLLWNVARVESAWMYPWGFLASAAATAAVVALAVQGGATARALSWGPLVRIGELSYGIYLLHWPVFLWLTPARVGWAPWPLFALRMAVTLVGAAAMYRLVEQPIRTGARLRGRWGPAGVPVAAAAVPVVAVALVAGTALLTADLPAPRALDRVGEAATDVAVAPPPPLRVLVLGDDLAAGSADLDVIGGDAPMEVDVVATPTCGLALGGSVVLPDGTVERDRDRCGDARDRWLAAVESARPDVVVVWAGLRDVADRRLSAEDPWSRPGDPALDDFLAGEVGDLLERLQATGSRVVVLTVPPVRNTVPPAPVPPGPPPADPDAALLAAASAELVARGAPRSGFSENDDARVAAWNQIVTTAAGRRGIPVLDAAGAMAAWPGGALDPARRADGVGLTPLGAAELAAWLAPRLREVGTTPVAVPATPTALDPNAVLPAAPPVTPRRTVPAGRDPRVLVVGDSVAYNYGVGLADWADDTGEIRLANGAQLGCAVSRGGSYRFERDIVDFEPTCDWSQTFPRYLAEQTPDVVLLSSGIWEVVDRRYPGDDRFRTITDPGVRRYLSSEWLSAVDLLASQGATVVLVTYPYFEAGKGQGFTDLPESDPARVDALNDLIREVAALRPGVTTVLDLNSWLGAQPGGHFDPAKRDDGVHFRDEYSRVIADWMGPQLVQLARTGPTPPG